MKIRFGGIIIAAIAAEVLAIVVLIVIVAVFGPSNQAAAETFAQKMGYWVGPVAGIILCTIGGWWVAKEMDSSRILNGFLVGFVVAAIDVSLLLLGDIEYQTIFVISNAGKVAAGAFGGWLAGRKAT